MIFFVSLVWLYLHARRLKEPDNRVVDRELLCDSVIADSSLKLVQTLILRGKQGNIIKLLFSSLAKKWSHGR